MKLSMPYLEEILNSPYAASALEETIPVRFQIDGVYHDLPSWRCLAAREAGVAIYTSVRDYPSLPPQVEVPIGGLLLGTVCKKCYGTPHLPPLAEVPAFSRLYLLAQVEDKQKSLQRLNKVSDATLRSRLGEIDELLIMARDLRDHADTPLQAHIEDLLNRLEETRLMIQEKL